MKNDRNGFPLLIAGFYAWITAVFFGGILLDIVYSHTLEGTLAASESRTVFSSVSDLILRIGFAVVLAAIGAIASSWNSPTARNLFIASLLIVSFEFLIPVVFACFMRNAQEINIGSWMRVIPGGLGSILAFAGLHNHQRHSLS